MKMKITANQTKSIFLPVKKRKVLTELKNMPYEDYGYFNGANFINYIILKNQSTIKKYLCSSCDQEFLCEIMLLNHRCMKQKIIYTSDIKSRRSDGGYKNNRVQKLFCKEDRPAEKTVKRFSCSICGKDFSTKSYMEYHEKVVHFKEKEYQCKFCNKSFGHKASLYNHNKFKVCTRNL